MARTPLLNLRVESETKDRWEAAAARLGLSLSEFIREAADAKAGHSALDARRGGKRSYEPDFKTTTAKGGKK